MLLSCPHLVSHCTHQSNDLHPQQRFNPLLTAVTAAPTIAFQLPRCRRCWFSASTSSDLEFGTSTLATGQESPRRASRPRTDAMVHSEGYTDSTGNGRGTRPIPIVRLRARLNKPEGKVHAGSGDKTTIAVAKLALVCKEPESFVVEERCEEAEFVKEELDFVPIDDEMEVINVTKSQEEKAELDADAPSGGEPVVIRPEPGVLSRCYRIKDRLFRKSSQ